MNTEGTTNCVGEKLDLKVNTNPKEIVNFGTINIAN